jgi:hypothetical protein
MATSATPSTLNLYDDIFELDSPNTLWALGNHDYTDTTLQSEYTLRPTYNSHTFRKAVFFVLDTEINGGWIEGAQLDMVNQVLDTLTDASHLILLHHKFIWMPGHPELEPIMTSVANGPMGNCPHCTPLGNFYNDIYPRLVEVQAAGKEVICIGGDLGIHQKPSNTSPMREFFS